MSVKEHYDNHLGNFYSWYTGDFTKNKILLVRPLDTGAGGEYCLVLLKCTFVLIFCCILFFGLVATRSMVLPVFGNFGKNYV